MKKNYFDTSQFHAVIWDMDGVIIDTEGFWPQAERAVLTKLGVPAHEDFENATMGLRSIDVVRFWHKRYPWNADLFPFEQLAQDITHRMGQFVEEQGKALPYVHDTLSFFHRKNMKQSIASSSSAFLIENVIKKLDIESYIDNFSSGEEEKLGKPAPDVYLTAAQKLSVDPRRCLVIEDSYNGALAGYRAGMQVIIIPYLLTPNDNSKLEKFKTIPNSILINNLSEIKELIR